MQSAAAIPDQPRLRRGTPVKDGNTVVKIYFDHKAGENRKPWRVWWMEAGKPTSEMFATHAEAHRA